MSLASTVRVDYGLTRSKNYQGQRAQFGFDV